LAEDRDCRAATDDGDRCHVRCWNRVAFQRISECVENGVDRLLEQTFQFGPGYRDIGVVSRQIHRDHRD